MTPAMISALCLLATAPLPDRMVDERMPVCLEVATRAAEAPDLDVYLVTAVAWEESKFHPDKESKAGARGPLQAIPKYFCPDGKLEGCDLTLAGFTAMRRFRARFADDWLCHYNQGNADCGRKARKYARRVTRLSESLRKRLTFFVDSPPAS